MVHRSALLAAVPLALAAAACPPPDGGDISGVEVLTPDKGVSFHIPPFDVPPGAEQQDCYFVRVPDLNGDGSDVWIDQFKIGQRSGSHHLNVFRVKTIVELDGEPNADGTPGGLVRNGECFDSGNWADWPLVVNSQESTVDDPIVEWKLPDGVAQRFSPGEKLMLQVHYVNADLQKTPNGGEARVNFYRAEPGDQIEMGTLFATQQSISVCQSNPNPKFDGACSFPPGTDIHVAAVNGHFHSRGERFRVYTWDGVTDETPPDDQRIYESTTWDDPPMTTGLDAVVPAGGGIWWTCEYGWEAPPVGCDALNELDPESREDCCYLFGGQVETSEHCNVFLYYWPKVENTDVFCN